MQYHVGCDKVEWACYLNTINFTLVHSMVTCLLIFCIYSAAFMLCDLQLSYCKSVHFKLHPLDCFRSKYGVKLKNRQRCLRHCVKAHWETVAGQASLGLWISFLSAVDIYKLNANVIVSIDHLFFPPVPGAWVCFVFSQHFKVKLEKIKSWNHYWERSEHKYFIIWYFLCKIEFMHGDVKAVRGQKYQAIVSLS